MRGVGDSGATVSRIKDLSERNEHEEEDDLLPGMAMWAALDRQGKFMSPST